MLVELQRTGFYSCLHIYIFYSSLNRPWHLRFLNVITLHIVLLNRAYYTTTKYLYEFLFQWFGTSRYAKKIHPQSVGFCHHHLVKTVILWFVWIDNFSQCFTMRSPVTIMRVYSLVLLKQKKKKHA